MSGARLFILLNPLWGIMILNYGWTVPPLSLSPHIDPLQYFTNTPRQMISLWRSIVQQVACSYRAKCLAVESGVRHLIPPRPETSQSPTRILVATDSLLAIEALRVGPLTMRDRVIEEIWIMLLPLVKRGHSVDSIFSPSHCGIPRSEAADEEATIARSLPQECIPIWHVDLLTAVKRL
ncbi:hypothetical protein C3747_238g41 [Trypanosoma cruzi]|uniref:Uncharacterized protein n=1 Tax=Trypanosoma cruzi TaxID=5693 RepID=A0A2V2VRM3_TRYCR|nr:hypothetical protein C3747_238g41 [Trypanosoma cruzi]